MAYFYCRHNDKARNSFLSVARSLLAQIFAPTKADDVIAYMYEKAATSSDANLNSSSLAKSLLEMTISTMQSTVFLVIDGIDECRRDDRREIAEWFQEVSDSIPVKEKSKFRCLFVSQDDGVSRKDFGNIPSIKITALDNRRDIEAFAAAWHRRIENKFGQLRSGHEHIANIVTARAQGQLRTSLRYSYRYT